MEDCREEWNYITGKDPGDSPTWHHPTALKWFILGGEGGGGGAGAGGLSHSKNDLAPLKLKRSVVMTSWACSTRNYHIHTSRYRLVIVEFTSSLEA